MDPISIDVNLVVDVVDVAGLHAWSDRLPALGLAGAWITPPADSEIDDASRELLAQADGPGRALQLVPVVTPPTGTGEFERAVRLAGTVGCRVLRVCPGAHGYPLVDWVLSPLPELCAREHLALLLDFGADPVPWRDVVDLARAFPAVPLVVLAGDTDSDRTIPAVLDSTANVVVELSRLRAVEVLVRLVTLFGAHRFVWGSGGSAAATAVLPAIADAGDLSPDDRAAVLHGNAGALGSGAYAGMFL